MQIVFFHHAGGDNYAFQNFIQKLNQDFKIIRYELPGRNYRLKESLLTDFEKIIDDAYNVISPQLEDNFIFVGMSMGALVAFLLTEQLNLKQHKLPKHLFLASRKSIEQYKHTPRVADTDDEQFWNYVKSFGANIEGILKHQELKEFYEPILRADFTALESFNQNHSDYLNIQLPINVSSIIGENDSHIDEMGAQSWQKYISGSFETKIFKGGHFFLYDNDEAIAYIQNKISEYY